MEVFTKLNAFEDEVFVEMEKIEKQIDELKEKQTKLPELARAMNHDQESTAQSPHLWDKILQLYVCNWQRTSTVDGR